MWIWESVVLKNERGERLVVELTFADSSVLMTNVGIHGNCHRRVVSL